MIVPPILITGLPRSGTSLTAGILNICGAWSGETFPPDPFNKKGNFENIAFRENLTKPYLSMAGFDSLGLSGLPPDNSEPLFSGHTWRGMVTQSIIDQGGGECPWFYKDAKLLLYWRQWHSAFPDATWIFVHRDIPMVIASCLRAHPMTTRMGFYYPTWEEWAGRYRQIWSEASTALRPMQIIPARDIMTNIAGMKNLIDKLPGLTWRAREVGDFIDAKLWSS